MKARLLTALIPLSLIAAPVPAQAQTAREFAYNFLREVGCQLLPLHACDLLDADNAVNIVRASQGLFVSRYCGTGFINMAVQAVQNGMADDNERCRQVLIAIGAMRP